MSNNPSPDPLPRAAVPPGPPPAPPARFPVLGCAFALSFVLNLVGGVLLILACAGLLLRGSTSTDTTSALDEKFHSGSRTSTRKIAVITLDSIIMEGFLSHVHRQIDAARKDSAVKAVVLRVNSPGGSVSASDDLHRRLVKLRDGDKDEDYAPKPLVVSMGSIAASGGYYVSAPAAKIFAEPVTMTASIGVYASLPRLSDDAQKWVGKMVTVKAGEIKDAGSMFRDMTPKERQVLQDMIDESYLQFLDVIQQGRKGLTKEVMLKRFPVKPIHPDEHLPQPPLKEYQRYRADGGTFSGRKAKELGLVDEVGNLDDAVKAAAKLSELEDYRAFRYLKKPTLSEALLGVKSPAPVPVGMEQLRAALTPRLWYLAADHEAAARLAVIPED